MPATSKKQLALIYAIRNKYKSKSKSPKKWKWVWGEEWGHLESRIMNFEKFNEAMGTLSKEDTDQIDDIILDFVETYKLSNKRFSRNSYSIERFDKFHIYLNFEFSNKESSEVVKDFETELNKLIEKIKRFGYDVFVLCFSMREVWSGYKYNFIISHTEETSKEILGESLLEANKNLESRVHLDECWYKAKIGDIVPEEYIYNYCQYLHDDYEGAFVEGDLGDRIEEYGKYKLMEIPISEISLDEFDLDDWAVGDYKDKIKETNDYPPIVLDDKQYGKHRIIDGTHRINAIKELGLKTIKSWVGVYES